MSLLHPGLLYGLLLAALPVLLHFLLRQKPRKLPFPALRLVELRRKQNLKRFRLRHVWLMLLRVLAIALVVFAIARPSLPAADYSFNWGEWLTLAVVIGLGVGAYFFVVRRWRRQELPKPVLQFRQSAARGWATGATLLALLLAVGCPYQQRIAAEIKAPPPAAALDLPVAAVFLFDASLSMTYQQGGKTRLDVARDIASQHLGELPEGSRVAIVDTAGENPVLFQTVSTSQARMQAVEAKAVSLPLNDRLRSCLTAHEEDRRRTLEEQGSVSEDLRKDRYLRRVYIFTDLARTAWRLGSSTLLKGEIERLKTVNVFLVDVGELSPTNMALTGLRLSRQEVSVGGQLQVSALLQKAGITPSQVSVELSRVRGAELINQAKLLAPLGSSAPQWLTFPLLTDVRGPVYHGEVRLVASDPLTMDDVRSFTVMVGKPAKVLVVAPDTLTARRWIVLLDPNQDQVKFAVDFVPLGRFGTTSLDGYDVAYFINVPQLPDIDWERIGLFVEQGGGAGFFLGSEAIQPRAYDRAAAQLFLPASLDVYRTRRDSRMSLDKPEHPVFRKLSENGGVPLLESDVYVDRFFRVHPAAGANVLATYTDTDRSPAIVERVHGRGLAVLMTTAVDSKSADPAAWNNFADPSVASWPAIALAESLTLYLARATENVFNVEAGEDVILKLGPSPAERTFLLKRPGFRQTRLPVPAGAAEVRISDARDVGSYDLVDSGQTTQPILGFSVTPPAAESDLTRLATPDLDQLLGEGRYQVARTIGELDATVSIADLGREVFPIVLLLAIVAFLGEHLVANRFYDVEEGPAGSPRISTTPPVSSAAGAGKSLV